MRFVEAVRARFDAVVHRARHAARATDRRLRSGGGALLERSPLELQLLGRMLFHAALVGVAAGLVGAAFFAALEHAQRLVLEQGAGYRALRAHGETFGAHVDVGAFRPWLLVLLPALGGLACGLLLRVAPDVAGGGGDAMIEAFHHKGGVLRRRLLWAKPLASICTLGTGGAGGREGPTMLIGGALGSLLGRLLDVGPRERRILLVAGVAAGIAAVFRTPLGAALLAVEVLYRDGFESDALVPSVFASVIAYSVVISVFGESTLFGVPGRFPFVPTHLPLYVALAVVESAAALLFVATLARVRATSARSRLPTWARPAIGGLLVGALATVVVTFVGARVGQPGQGLGILGGGYGAVQIAISGSPLLGDGWRAAELLLLLAVAKLVAASLTIGTGGSAGDFAPSLAIGGLVGGAFGTAASLLLDDPRIAPGAFALVGMGAFYGGVAHVPLAALVLVCEMAGSYDLLVPLMLSLGVSFVLCRTRSLYPAQVRTLHESPVHREAFSLHALKAVRVRDAMRNAKPHASFVKKTRAPDMLAAASDHAWQEVFPVVDAAGAIVGMVTSDALRVLASNPAAAAATIAADLMQPAPVVQPDDDLHDATRVLLGSGVRELPVVDEQRHVIGFLDEAQVAALVVPVAAPG